MLGSSGKTAAFQVGEQRPREGTGLTQGHTAATPMPLLPKSSLCAIKWIQRLHISIQIQNPCSFSTSSSQLGNCHPVSQVTEILIHVGLLLDLSRLPPGWQVWSLSQTLCYLFCGFSRTLHLESYWVGVPCPSEEESHVRAKLRGGDSEQSLLPMSSCSHGLALTPWLLPVHPWSCPPPGGAVSPQMAAPSSDAAGRRGRDTWVFRLLWKEATAMKAGPGSHRRELWSWAPTHRPC